MNRHIPKGHKSRKESRKLVILKQYCINWNWKILCRMNPTLARALLHGGLCGKIISVDDDVSRLLNCANCRYVSTIRQNTMQNHIHKMTPSHVSRYLFHGQEILLKYSDGVMMPSTFSLLLAAHLLLPHDNAKTALDLGSGSGIQGIILAKLGWFEVFAVDIDKRCLAATEFNSLLNQVSEYSIGTKQRVVAVHSNGFERISGLKFDLIVSNPPTLPTTDETPPFAAGGPTGREFLDSMIMHSCKALNPGGRLIFVQSSLADIEQTKTLLRNCDFSVKIVRRKRLPFRDFYMPHLFFYRRQAMLHQKAIYQENKDGTLCETLYVINARLKA